MSDSKTLQLEIKVGADGLVEGLKLATKSVDDTVQKVKQAFRASATEAKDAGDAIHGMGAKVRGDLETIGREAEHAETPIGALADTIRDFTREQRQEGFLANYMASQIANLGLSSKSAAGEITGLVSAFSFGGAIGVGIELLKDGAEAFNELRKEEDAAAAASKAWADQQAADLKRTEADFRKTDRSEGLKGSELELAQKLSPILDELADAQERFTRAKNKAEAARGAEAQGDPGATYKKTAAAIKEELAAFEKLEAALKAKRDLEGAFEPRIHKESGDAANASAADEATKQQEAEQLEKQHQLKLMQIRAESLQGIKKIRADERIAIAGVQDEEKLTVAQKQSEIVALRKKFAGEITKAEREEYLKRAHAEFDAQQAMRSLQEQIAKDNSDAKIAADERAWHAKQKIDEETRKTDDATREEAKKQAREEIATARELGQSIGSVFAELADKTRSLNSILKSFASEAIGALASLAEKTIENAALSAGANAAIAPAAVPIVGPALAVASMAGMSALVRGLLGGIHSAAGGFDIPGSINPIVQAHAREMILPARIADPLRQSIDNGSLGGGGGDIHVHTQDAFGMERTLRRNKAALIQTARQIRSTGRKG